jgi:hypothetical protein
VGVRLSSASAASIGSSSQSIFAGHVFDGCSSSVFRPLPVISATTLRELLEHDDRRAARRLGEQALRRREQVDAGEYLGGEGVGNISEATPRGRWQAGL